MTEYTFDINIFSDFHKDAYGFRPRGHRFYHEDTTDAERQQMWDAILVAADQAMVEEEARQAEAITDFETLIVETIGYGAKDRNTAIRWIVEGYDETDVGYVCYRLGIPYSYETQLAAAIQ